MVAESKPARRRVDSTAPRSKSRRRALMLTLAAAALAGIVATPIAANAGVDPADGLRAVLDFAGGDTGVEAGAGSSSAEASASGGTTARSAPTQSIDDESTGLSVRVSPAISTSISLAGPIAISVEIENATGEALSPALVRLVRSGGSIDDGTDLDDWLAAGSGDGAAIGGSTVTLAESESRGLAAGGATVVSFTLPAEAFSQLADSSIIGIGAELVVGDAIVASGTDAFPNADVPAAGSVAVALVAPLTAPIAGGGTGLIEAAQLENWTGPTGLLTRQLDALAGRRVAIGLDPRIIASVRVLGSSAPASATAWLQRLANLPNEVFPLAYADADIAVQAQLSLPELLAPTSFTDVLDPANFTTPADDGDADADDAGDAGAPATDAPAEPDPTPGDVPTTDELLEWPYTRTDIGWPADDTVSTGDLAFLDAVGLTTALLAAGNAEPIDGAASSSANIEGSTALVADAGLTEALRAASVASTDTEWRAETGRLLSELALDAGAARTTVLATFDRGAPARSDRVSALIDQIGGSAWSTLAGLADAIGAPPENRMLVDQPEPDDRLADVQRMVDAEADVSEFATVLADSRLLTGPTRRGLLSLLDVAWLADDQAWDAAVADWLTTQRSVLGAVSVVPSSTINVVSTETGVPATVDNTLPYPVTVVVDVDPSNGRLIVEDPVEVTVEAQSRSTVRVPVEAGVGNGEVSLAVSLSSPEGVPIGSTVTIPANVQADWEGLGAAILATIAVLVFGIGIWRNIRRRRRERAAASTDAASTGEASHASEASDASGAPGDPSDTAAATHIEASDPRRD